MLNLPIIRFGETYDSLEKDPIVHFDTGEPIATMSRANGGMVQRDLRKAQKSRDALRKIPIHDLIAMVKKAGELFTNATLTIGDGKQSPDDFVHAQSASTGLPEHMCRSNMQKNAFVLAEMDKILSSLTRGLDLNILTRGHGEERGVPISYQAQTSVVGLVLPSNSPGVHTLWLPIIPLQVGLVLKPGSSEPWTPFRMAAAFFEAGIPKEAISLYPGPTDVGGAILTGCDRSMIFGGQQTIDLYKSNPKVQPHGPGFSKIFIADDQVDNWEKYLDLMYMSVFANSGRSCINASGIWVSRHGKEIADALAKKLASVEPLPPTHPEAPLAAFCIPNAANSINNMIDADLKTPGVTDYTAKYRQAPRLIKKERCDYLLPTVIHCNSHETPVANREYMFPYVSVVDCPEDQFIKTAGPTLVCTAITDKPELRSALLDATHIDRLNFGPIPTVKLNWLQPHEGNIVDFLYRARAFQSAP